MKTPTQSPTSSSRIRQRGVAAIEAALLLPILLVMLTFPIFYARCLWHYTVAQKAAHDAARYLASVPRAEMSSSALQAAAGNRAIAIATREIAELAPGGEMVSPTAYCNTAVCGRLLPIGTVPSQATVELGFTMTDPLFGVESWGITITASVTLNYAGS